MSFQDIGTSVQDAASLWERVFREQGKKVIGQRLLMERLAAALMIEGHVLLEGLPGLAKTTVIKTLAQVTSLSFKRVQFTADLLPADIIGTQLYSPKSENFLVKKGPLFAHFVLADEINRASARVQSALLEAMEEKQVTLGDETFSLENPFLVMATQNPMEQEGTYPLPEAQMDRFLFKVLVSYPSFVEEEEMLRRRGEALEPLQKIISREVLLEMKALTEKIHVADRIRHYIISIVDATRYPGKYKLPHLETWIQYGASPRASLALEKASRAHALLAGRSYVTPQDIKDLSQDVLRHRLKLSYEAEAEGKTPEDVIQKILEIIEVP